MSAICLSNELVEQYLKFSFKKSFDKNIIQKLFKYLQSFLVSTNQHRAFQDPAFLPQIATDPLLNPVGNLSKEELVKKTTLKLMLVDKKTDTNYTEVNIKPILVNQEKIDMLITATYVNSNDKQEAINHIKNLVSDGKYIKIIDRYLPIQNSWSQNLALLKEILPQSKKDIIFECGSQTYNESSLNSSQKQELKNICNLWTIKSFQLNDALIHDRYIETDKLKILLSSGWYNISTNSNKDFTYSVKIKG